MTARRHRRGPPGTGLARRAPASDRVGGRGHRRSCPHAGCRPAAGVGVPDRPGLMPEPAARPYTSRPVADLPIDLETGLSEHLARILDVEGKIPRAIEALGPVEGRDVVVVDGSGGSARSTARRRSVPGSRSSTRAGRRRSTRPTPRPTSSSACGPRSAAPIDPTSTRRHGCSDPAGGSSSSTTTAVTTWRELRGDLPEYGTWTRRDGPFLRSGFKIRVLHCWWTFDSLDEARTFLDAAFGEAGRTVAGPVDATAPVVQRRGLPSDPRQGAVMTDRRASDPIRRPAPRATPTSTTSMRATNRSAAAGASPRSRSSSQSRSSGSIAYMAYVLTVREATQIPLLASGAVMLAIVFAALAAFCLRSIWRAGTEPGQGGRMLLTALVGGPGGHGRGRASRPPRSSCSSSPPGRAERDPLLDSAPGPTERPHRLEA